MVSDLNQDGLVLGISEHIYDREKETCDSFHQTLPPRSPSDVLFCRRVFDGVGCWNDTDAGTLAFTNCPKYLPGFNPEQRISKSCLEDGKWFIHPSNNWPWANLTNCTLESNSSASIMKEILSDSGEEDVTAGIPISVQSLLTAKESCDNLHQDMTDNELSEGLFCPRIFDGWSCWNDTAAGTTAITNCPSFVAGFYSERFAHKECTENGTWFIHPDSLKVWSNYTLCLDQVAFQKHQGVNQIYIIGYSISFIALFISLFIFFYFRSLKCKRVTIHKNLFFSFLMNNFLWLVWQLTFIGNNTILTNNGVWCQAVHIVMYYFLVSSYMWMFCEGFYLHTLLVLTFVSESRILKWFLALGWGFPVGLMAVYSIARGLDTTHNKMCWMDEENPYFYIIAIPVFISLVINLCFLINIVRVLLTKLRAVNTNRDDDNSSTRKAVRATFILIPLLGLHYILVPFRPRAGTAGELVYLIVSAIAASFQGFAVSLLFCFFNGEVLAIFRRKWNQGKLMRSPKSYNPATSVSYMRTSMADGVTLMTTYEPTIEADDV